jgi:hypothetical protein
MSMSSNTTTWFIWTSLLYFMKFVVAICSADSHWCTWVIWVMAMTYFWPARHLRRIQVLGGCHGDGVCEGDTVLMVTGCDVVMSSRRIRRPPSSVCWAGSRTRCPRCPSTTSTATGGTARPWAPWWTTAPPVSGARTSCFLSVPGPMGEEDGGECRRRWGMGIWLYTIVLVLGLI